MAPYYFPGVNNPVVAPLAGEQFPVTASLDFAFNTTTTVTQTQAFTFLMNAYVKKSVGFQWSLASRIGRSKSFDWELHASVRALRTYQWNTRAGSVVKTISFTHNTRQRIRWTGVPRFTLGLLQPVVSPVDAADTFIPYGTMNWNAYVRAHKTQTFNFRTFGGVAKTQAMTHNTRQRVAKTQGILYNVPYLQITKTQPFNWATVGRVSSTRTIGFYTRQGVVKTRDYGWYTRARVAKTQGLTWGTRTRVTATEPIKYNAYARKVTKKISNWRTLQGVTKTRDILSNTRTRVAKTQGITYFARAKVAKTQGMTYFVRTRKAKEVPFYFRAGGRINAQKSFTWLTMAKVKLRENLCVNPSVETNLDGYNNDLGPLGTLSQDFTQSVFGSASVLMVNSGSANQAVATPAISVNGTYSFSLYLRTDEVDAPVLVSLFSDSDYSGAFPDGLPFVQVNAGPDWQRITIENVSLHGGPIYLIAYCGFTNAHMYLDGLQYEKNDVCTPYIDGSFTGVAWEGTPNASASTEVWPEFIWEMDTQAVSAPFTFRYKQQQSRRTNVDVVFNSLFAATPFEEDMEWVTDLNAQSDYSYLASTRLENL